MFHCLAAVVLLAQLSHCELYDHVEAEDGTVVSPMKIFEEEIDGVLVKYVGSDGANCSIKDPSGAQPRHPNPVGYVTVPFEVPYTAPVTFYMHIRTPDSLSDSFWARVDEGEPMSWFTEQHSDFSTDIFTPFSPVDPSLTQRCFVLSQGQHNLTLYIREPGAAVDYIMVMNNAPLDTLPDFQGCSGGCSIQGGSLARFHVRNLCGPGDGMGVNVTIGGLPCRDVWYDDPNTLACYTPPLPGEGVVHSAVVTQFSSSITIPIEYQLVPLPPPESVFHQFWYLFFLGGFLFALAVAVVALAVVRSRTKEAGKRPPPQGLISLVFVGVHDSTSLWEKHGKVMRDAYAVYSAVLRENVKSCKGYEVKTEGDVRLLAFDTVMDAARFCCQVQLALVEAPWSEELLQIPQCAEHLPEWRGLRVSMGIHYGEPTLQQNSITRRMDYFGPVVNRTARVQKLAYGGMILMTNEARVALNEELSYDDFVEAIASTRTTPRLHPSATNIGTGFHNLGKIPSMGDCEAPPDNIPSPRAKGTSPSMSPTVEASAPPLNTNTQGSKTPQNNSGELTYNAAQETASHLQLAIPFEVGGVKVEQVLAGIFYLKGIARPQRLHMLRPASISEREFPALKGNIIHYGNPLLQRAASSA